MTNFIRSYKYSFPDSSVSKESVQVGKIHQRREKLPNPVFLGFPCGSAGKESVCNEGDLGLTLGLRRSPGEEKGYPLQCSGLKNSMDCIIHGVSKVSDVTERLSVHFTNIAYSIFHYLRQNSTKKKCNIMVINIYEMCNKLKKNDILQSDSNKNLLVPTTRLREYWVPKQI